MTELEKLLGNPVAYRILQIVAAEKTATTFTIADKMPDISRATIYRYCKRMAGNDILETISEEKIRGQICRTYTVSRVTISGNEETNDCMTAALLFLRQASRKYEVYFSKNDIDTRRDKLFMVSPDLNLDDTAYNELCDRMKKLVLEYQARKPVPGSRIRNLYLMSAPDESWEEI